MPLNTRTINLREERDRLDSELDELAEREAELQYELETTDTDDEDAAAAEAQRILDEIRDIQEDAQQTQSYLTGIAVTINEYGQPVATDGGTATDTPGDAGTTESEEVARAREEMRSDTSDVVNDQPDQDEQGRPVGGDTGNESAPTTPETPTGGGERSENGTESASDGPLTIALGGLTAGEYARAADLANAAERGRIGFAESGAGEERTRNIFVAAGTHAAPYLSESMDLNAKADAIADLSPDYVQWAEEQIMELTSPPEAVGNGYSSRVESILEAKRNDATEDET